MTPTLLSDSMTIAYKEWREWFARSARPGWLGLMLLMVIWSMAAPFALRQVSAGTMLMVLVWLSLPMAISGVVVADSFAGERERLASHEQDLDLVKRAAPLCDEIEHCGRAPRRGVQ